MTRSMNVEQLMMKNIMRVVVAGSFIAIVAKIAVLFG